ncbi:hypothetical protein [Streptomyces sp. NPDC090021]|uniref:hypothetical protein n=1 Tax=Streptomyces sp. NPDC090021 TaxID=3365919 RepID=UPI0037F13246
MSARPGTAATPPREFGTLVIGHWAFDGIGLTPDLERFAALIGGRPRSEAVTACA